MTRYSAPLVLITLSFGSMVCGSSDPAVLRATVQFDRARSANAWFAAFGVKQHYVASLQPVFDISREPSGWDFAVTAPGETENVLEPSGNWHGLQAYNLVADDLLHGIDRSAFGRVRSFRINGGISIRLEIQEAVVAPDAKGNARFSLLKVLVTADGLR